MTKLKPSKEIIICTQPSEETTDEGISLGISSNKDRPETGIVYAIGSGELPIEVKVGDKVVYRKYSESEVFIGGKRYNFLDFKDIVAVIETTTEEN